MQKPKIGIIALVTASLIATLTALAHLSCLYFGPKCYQVQMAPQVIVQSAIEGTWLAPIGTIIISIIFFLCAAYALSGAGMIKKIPLLSLGIYSISIVCFLRVLIVLLFFIRYPETTTTSAIVAEIVWFAVGLLFFLGYRNAPNKTP